jgi:hypothetical protein
MANTIDIRLPDGSIEKVEISGESPTEEELLAIQNTFFAEQVPETVTPEETPEPPAPVFTSDQYYEGGRDKYGRMRNTVGQVFPSEFTDEEMSGPIYDGLSNNVEGWENMSLRERRNMFDNAVVDANTETFKTKGEENSIGLRVQRSTDEDGDPVTYLVPPPQSAETSGFSRALGGAGFETAKSLGRLAEGVTDFLRITDPETDFVKENFPTIPPENGLEAAGSEFASILLGSIGGAGLASKLEKTYKMAPKTANYVAKQWSKIKGKNPENMRDAAEAFAKVFIIGTGTNLGATANTPQQSDPFFGDEVVEFLGIDPAENRNLTNFADNLTFSAGLGALGLAFRGITHFGGKAIPVGKFRQKNREVEQGAAIFKLLDHNLEEGIPATVFADRARILGEVIRDNGTFRSELLSNGEITTDTTTALFLGAQDYVRRAYGWQKTVLGEEGFEKFVNDNASAMAGRMAAIRKARMTSEPVQNAGAAMDASMQQALNSTAEDLGGIAATRNSGSQLGQPIVDDVVDAQTRTVNATDTLRMAEAGLNSAQTKNYVTDLLRESIRNNPLASNVRAKDALDRMTGEQLYNAWRKSFSGYNEAFKNLPDIPLPVEDFVDVVSKAYPDPKQWPNIIEQVTITDTVADPIGRLMSLVTPKTTEAPNGELVTETYEEMISRLSNTNPPVSFKQVFTKLRPMLEDRISTLIDRGLKPQADQLISLKRGIDAIAENIGDPAFIQAKNAYAAHADTWLNSAPLRQFEAAAKEVNDKLVGPSGVAKGMPDAQRAGANARTEALEGGFLPYQEQFVRAMDTDSATPELAMAYISEAINGVRQGLAAGKLPGSQDIVAGIQPYLPVLERLAPDQVDKFRSVVGDLSMAEAGLVSAKEIKVNADQVYAETIKKARDDQASRFVFDLTGNPKVRDNAPAAFNEIFNSPDSVDIMQRLISKAEEINDPLVIQGMQSQYLTWLGGKLNTARRTAISPEDSTSAVLGYSAAQLNKALRDPASPILKTLSILFKDTPERAAEVVRLMEIKDIIVNGRALRGDTYGSTTTYDKDIKKLVDRVVVLSLGVLNPKATVARNLGEALTQGYREQINRSANATFDMMVASPEKFNEMMQLLAEANEKGAVQLLTEHLGRSAYGSNMDEQTREALSIE